MAFGQSAGPPAGQRQLDQLAELFQRAGYASFREARHPYGLNQRQAAGRFTGPEAEDLIERLEAAEEVRWGDERAAPVEPPRVTTDLTTDAVTPRLRRAQRKVEVLSVFDDDLLVEELERRGWCCIPPITGVDQD